MDGWRSACSYETIMSWRTGAICFAAAAIAAACGDEREEDHDTADEFTDADRLTEAELATIPEARGALTFARPCEGTSTLRLAAVGDVMAHAPLQKQAFSEPDGFGSLWRDVAPLLTRADLAYANLEGTTAAGVAKGGLLAPDPGRIFDNRVYTSFPLFNYHPSLADDLQHAGIDIVSTANNHALDRAPIGVDRTIDAVQAAGLSFTGTVRRKDRGAWFTVGESKGFRVAFLACTFGTRKNWDPEQQTLRCYDVPNDDVIEGPPNPSLLSLTRALSDRPDVDAVVVTAHWGVEDRYEARPAQTALGRALIEAGAQVVLGSHPHVLEPWEKYVAQDGREGLIVYSLGNFISGLPRFGERTSALLDVELGKVDGGKAFVRRVGFVPLYLSRERGVIGVRPAERDGSSKDAWRVATRIWGSANVIGRDGAFTRDCR